MISGIVHGGKLGGALWVLSQTEELVRQAFFPSCKTEKFSKVKRIYTVGHSLGGSIATLLAILLREFILDNKIQFPNGELPEIRAFTFSSSAAISYNLSRWCRSFVDSFIIGMDIVPRFSVGQAEKLRTEIVDTNYQSKVERYLRQHKKTAKFIKSFNRYLSNHGRNPLVKFELGNASTPTEARDGTIIEQIGANSYEIAISSPENEAGQQSTATIANHDITTLYPPGNIYWFVYEKIDKVEKDFAKMLFEYIEQKLADDAEIINQKLHSTGKLFKTWWKEKNLKKHKEQAPKKRKECIVRHVDAHHFDCIILTRNVFSDHKLLKYFDMLTYVLEVNTTSAPLPTDNNNKEGIVS